MRRRSYHPGHFSPFPFLRVLAAMVLLAALPLSQAGAQLQVGSKRFTESYVLGEQPPGTVQ